MAGFSEKKKLFYKPQAPRIFIVSQENLPAVWLLRALAPSRFRPAPFLSHARCFLQLGR